MWMNGSIRQSLRPASRTRTLVPLSAERRFARAHPAEPPPTMTTSYRSLAIRRPLPLEPLGRGLRTGRDRRRGSLARLVPGVPEPALLGGPDVVPHVLGLAVLVEPGQPELAPDA